MSRKSHVKLKKMVVSGKTWCWPMPRADVEKSVAFEASPLRPPLSALMLSQNFSEQYALESRKYIRPKEFVREHV
jgi:hypothetical protein